MVVNKMDNDGNDDSLTIARKSWTRIIDAASKTGFREGVEEGSRSVLQKDFDAGYEDGFKAAFKLGIYKGLSTTFCKNRENPDDIVRILDKTKRGACRICHLESKDIDSCNPMAIIDTQRKHVESTLNTLQEYFSPLLLEKGIDIELLKN